MTSSVRPTLTRSARLVLLGSFVNALGTGLVLPFLLIYLHQVRGIALGTTGALLALPGVVALASGLAGGTLLDRYGPRRVLVFACVSSTCGSALLPLVHRAAWAVPVLVLVGLGNATFFSSQNYLFTRVAEAASVERLFATNFVLLNAGIGVGGLVAGSIVSVRHPATFVALFLANAASFLVYAVIVATLDLPAPPHGEHADAGSYRAAWREPRFRWVVGLSLLVAVLGAAQVDAGFPAFATVTLALPPRAVAFALVANTAVIVLGQHVVLRRIAVGSRTGALVTAAALWAASWLLLGLGTAVSSAGPRWVAAVGFGVLFALGETFVAPALGPLTSAVAPDALRGRFFATSAVAYALSFTAAPLVSTAMIGHGAGIAWIALLVAGCGALAGAARAFGRRLRPEEDAAGAAVEAPAPGPGLDPAAQPR